MPFLLALQVDVCEMNSVKFDFVGQLENLPEDAGTVMRLLGVENPSMDAFDAGKAAHPTAANKRLQAMYGNQVRHSVYWSAFFTKPCSIDSSVGTVLC